MLPITTERLVIREFSIIDAAFIVELMNCPGWIRFIGDRNVKTRSAASNYIQDKIIRSYRNIGFGLYLVLLKDTKTPIGMCGLVKREGLQNPDLGFALLPQYENTGYTSEAAGAVIQYARQVLQLKELDGITTADNKASVRVLEKAGLIFLEQKLLPGHPNSFMLFTMVLHNQAV